MFFAYSSEIKVWSSARRSSVKGHSTWGISVILNGWYILTQLHLQEIQIEKDKTSMSDKIPV